MAILVSNAINSSGEVCDGKCPSWLLHWENCTGNRAEKCSVVGCEESGLVGAHVYIEDENADEDECYIIPLCRSHNFFDVEEFYVYNDIDFVPGTELDTCTAYFEYDDEEEEE